MTSHLKNNRRIVLQSILGTSTIALGGMHQILSYAQAPALITSDKNRPKSPSGTQTGDVNTNSGILWSRSDREAKMWVTWDTTQSFSNPKVLSGPYA